MNFNIVKNGRSERLQDYVTVVLLHYLSINRVIYERFTRTNVIMTVKTKQKTAFWCGIRIMITRLSYSNKKRN